MGAQLSPCSRFRYLLWRQWDVGPSVLWLMLNPSRADAERDDATVRKCVGFSRRWGYGQLSIVNLFSLVATKPEEIARALDRWRPGDPHPSGGRTAEEHILIASARSHGIVYAWGGCAAPWPFRTYHVTSLVEAARGGRPPPPQCLGYTKHGAPRHPVRLSYATPLELYQPPPKIDRRTPISG